MMTLDSNGPSAATPSIDTLRYDSRALATALTTLSRAEIESMLEDISRLETRITKLSVAGQQDAMMHLVTDGLRRLTFFLDAVQRYKDENGQE